MPHFMYVAVQEDDKILVFSLDSQTGKLTPRADVAVTGGPFTLAISPDRKLSIRRMPRDPAAVQLPD